MSHVVGFRSRLEFDPGHASITVSVDLALGNDVVVTDAKIDTGSSHCVFALETADGLGLAVETGVPLTVITVTGDFQAFGHTVTLSVGGIDVDAMVYFAALPGFPRNILGRRGWLDRLRLGLVDYDGTLFLSHYDDEQT